MKVLGAFLLLVPALLGQVIEGTVVDSVTGAPIGGASVQIENTGKTPYQTTADAQGAFHIEGVVDGAYTAIAFKNGFQTVRDEAALRPFRVVAGLDPVQLKISLIPWGRISGRVFDGEDNKVGGADVSLMQGNGSGQTSPADANGGFTFDIAPGSYFLSAQAPPKFASPAAIGDQHYAWAKTWFPGVSDAKAAQKILIRPGVDLVGQDFKLLAVNAYTIRGQIRDSNGEPVAKLTVKLARAAEYRSPLDRTTVSGKDGGFEFADVYDGDWRLSAERSGDVVQRGSVAATVTGRDAEGVELQLSAPFQVPVEFLLETEDSTTKIQGSVVLEPDGGGAAPASNRGKDGNYKVDGLYPGRYLIKALPLAGRGYYLASVKLGDRDVLGQIVELRSDSPPLRIVYRSDGGAIRGTVDGCGNASIVVVPQDPMFQRGDAAAVHVSRCSANGDFAISNLRAGRYYAFAFDQWDMNAANFLSGLQALTNKAVSVEVTAGQTANVELKVTSPS